MLRSWKFTALIGSLVLATSGLVGCNASLGRAGGDFGGGGGDGKGGGYKPTPGDYQGEVLSFGGHWEGACEALINGADRTDCTMSMDIKQESMLVNGSFSVFGTITIGNQIRSFQMPVMAINKNDLQGYGSGQAAGSIGSGAFRIFEEQFAGLTAKALRKDSRNQTATQLGILATQIKGFSLLSTGGGTCGKSNCFAANLVLKGQ